MVSFNGPFNEIPHRRPDVRVFAMDVDGEPVAIFVRVLPEKTRLQVKGKLARLSRRIEAAATPELANKLSGKFGALIQKAVIEQCLGAATITSLNEAGDLSVEVPSDLDEATPARLSVGQIGILLAALDLAP